MRTPNSTGPLLRPFAGRDFRIFWLGENVSVLGDQFHFIAVAWLALQLTGSGLALGGVLMAAAIPRAVFINVDNIISGAGQLGNGTLTLDNRGVIDADGANALVIDTGSAAVINSGTIAATGPGGLSIAGEHKIAGHASGPTSQVSPAALFNRYAAHASRNRVWNPASDCSFRWTETGSTRQHGFFQYRRSTSLE